MKEHPSFLRNGIFHRLLSPFEGNEAAWMVADLEYKISDRDYTCYGDELMQIGLILSDGASGVRTLPVAQGDYSSRIFLLEAFV